MIDRKRIRWFQEGLDEPRSAQRGLGRSQAPLGGTPLLSRLREPPGMSLCSWASEPGWYCIFLGLRLEEAKDQSDRRARCRALARRAIFPTIGRDRGSSRGAEAARIVAPKPPRASRGWLPMTRGGACRWRGPACEWSSVCWTDPHRMWRWHTGGIHDLPPSPRGVLG